jgi:ankyrin repeat protein
MRFLNRKIIPKFISCLLIALLVIAGCADPDRPTIGFHLALQRGDIDQIERHIFWNADINKAGPNGQMPLHVAAEQGRPIVTELLLKHGAEINSRDNKGNTPLHTAVMSGRTQVAEFLIKRGAQFNSDRLLEDMVLNSVTDRDVIRFLLRNGADINRISDQGNTPLLDAIKQGNRVMVKLLIANGSDVNKTGKSGQTPLQLAKQIKDDSIVRLLVKNGAVNK